MERPIGLQGKQFIACLALLLLVQNGGNNDNWRFFMAYRVSSDLDDALTLLAFMCCVDDATSAGLDLMASGEGNVGG